MGSLGGQGRVGDGMLACCSADGSLARQGMPLSQESRSRRGEHGQWGHGPWAMAQVGAAWMARLRAPACPLLRKPSS